MKIYLSKKIKGISTFKELEDMINKVNDLDALEMFKPFPLPNSEYSSNEKYISNTKDELLDYYKKRMYWQYIIKNAMSSSIKFDRDTN